MATPLDEIYESFLSKVEDYKFIKLNKTGDLESLLQSFLRSSIVRFNNCTKELTIDSVNNSISEDLNMEEIEILASFMVLIYSTGKITSIKNMELELTKSEYYTYSKANHLVSLIEVKKQIQSDVSHLQNLYSLKFGSDF